MLALQKLSRLHSRLLKRSFDTYHRSQSHWSKVAALNSMASARCCDNQESLHRHSFDGLLAANREWAAAVRAADPEFFNRLVNQQHPEYLWIGCSDSRVPANQILGLAPGEIFVQRNVGNQAMHTDLNLMACLEYAVKSLKVKTVILCGHYNCGAVKAALQLPHTTPSLVNCWISDIRECRNRAEDELRGLGPEQQLARWAAAAAKRMQLHTCMLFSSVCECLACQLRTQSPCSIMLSSVFIAWPHASPSSLYVSAL
eukprot:GHRQ01018794.1.p1 GENE.GHRQ01018794.1~~GHRQ01018794.1.p1  ORF type:complete len:296 (+),score=68.33 GHRQ01018794.1:120-890(+)